MRRLDQLLANLGYCSRREARAWIEASHVTVGGAVAEDYGQKARPADVRVDGEPLDNPDGLLLLVHKPAGLVCSHDEREGPNVYSLLPPRWRQRNPQVTSIGRLDKDTTGLLLLTDQTALVHRLTSPKTQGAQGLPRHSGPRTHAGPDPAFCQRRPPTRRRKGTLPAGRVENHHTP